MISEVLLFFGHPPAIVFLFSLVYWFSSKAEGRHLLLLVSISMIVNAALKLYFKIPLKPHMADQNWYAFPSGHMQLASVFYGHLFWVYRQKYKPLWGIILLLGGYGWALIDQNFHDYADVGAGFAVGVLVLVLYQGSVRVAFKYGVERYMGLWWLFMTLPCLGYISLQVIPVIHAWRAQGAILGIVLATLLIRRQSYDSFRSVPILEKGADCIMGIFGIFMLWLGNGLLLRPLGYPAFPLMSFFLLGFWLGGAADFVWDRLRPMFRRIR